jgi:hypothetical protein
MMYNALVYLYSTIAPEGSPAAVTDVGIMPNVGGENAVSLSWTNPTETAQGETLTSLTAINIYIDDAETPSHTINNPTIGGEEMWIATDLNNGVVHFTIVGENENGEGRPYSISTFVGPDVPAAVTDLTLTAQDENGKLTWTAPTTGLHNGEIGSSTINYTIVRLPDEVTVATNHTSTTFIDNNVPGLGFYSYKVTASNAQGEGGSAVSNTEMVGPAYTPPYTMGFEDDEQYSVWTIIDANYDNRTWTREPNIGVLGGYAMRYRYSSGNPADDWLISPKLNLEAGKNYTIALKACQNQVNYIETFKVFLGTGVNAEDFTIELFDVETSDQPVTTEYQQYFISAEVETSGEYYVAIQATSEPDQYFFYVDDFEIYETCDYDLKALSFIGPVRAIVGKETEVKVELQNMGLQTASGYSINILDNNGNILASAEDADCLDIEPDEIVTIPVSLIPQAEGELSVHAQIVFEGDTNLFNNESESIVINVLPNEGGTAIAQIGSGEYKNQNIPINFYYKKSFSQVIYKQEDINLTQGDATGITYQYNFSNTVEDKAVKIWMANTDKEVFESGTDYIPLDEFILVFDGTVTIEAGEGYVDFDLISDAFNYTGGNIAIMVEKLDDSYRSGCNFYQTETGTKDNISIYYRSDATIFDFTQSCTLASYYPNVLLTFNNTGEDVTDCAPIANLAATVEEDVVTLTWTHDSRGRAVVLSEGFEDGVIPEGWTTIDNDGDERGWYIKESIDGYESAYSVISESWYSSNGKEGRPAVEPDNYLVTPELSLTDGGTLTYYVRTNNASYPAEHYAVYASTGGNSVDDFVTILFEETLEGNVEKVAKDDRNPKEPGEWLERTVELPVGTKYVAFRHYDCYNEWSMGIDNIEITAESNIEPPVEVTFNIYRDSELLGSTTELTYEDTGLESGTYNYCVRVVCGEGSVSNQVCVDATVTLFEEECTPIANLESEVEGDVVTLTWTYNNGREVVLSEDFEGGDIPSDWTQIDADGDGNMWFTFAESHGTGNYCATSASWTYPIALTPDNYLVTPELSLPEGGTLTYWVCAQDGAFPTDHYGIFYSTSGNDVNDFNTTPLFEETLTAKHVGPKGDRGTNELGAWYERTVELPAGTKYVAFRHYDCTMRLE